MCFSFSFTVLACFVWFFCMLPCLISNKTALSPLSVEVSSWGPWKNVCLRREKWKTMLNVWGRSKLPNKELIWLCFIWLNTLKVFTSLIVIEDRFYYYRMVISYSVFFLKALMHLYFYLSVYKTSLDLKDMSSKLLYLRKCKLKMICAIVYIFPHFRETGIFWTVP